MTTLYVLREEPTTEDLEIMSHVEEGDAALLLQEAVTALDEIEPRLPLHVCHRDAEIRDVDIGAAERADYDDIADLIAEHDTVVSL